MQAVTTPSTTDEIRFHHCLYASTGIEMKTLAIKRSNFISEKASNFCRRPISFQLPSSTFGFEPALYPRSLHQGHLSIKHRLVLQDSRLGGAFALAFFVDECTPYDSPAQTTGHLSASGWHRVLSTRKSSNREEIVPVGTSHLGCLGTATRSGTYLEFTKNSHQFHHDTLVRSTLLRFTKYRFSLLPKRTGQMSGTHSVLARPWRSLRFGAATEIPIEGLVFELYTGLEISELAVRSGEGAATEWARRLLHESQSIQPIKKIRDVCATLSGFYFSAKYVILRLPDHFPYAASKPDSEFKVLLTKC